MTESAGHNLKVGFLSGLRDLLGDRVSTAEAVRDHHGKSEGPYPSQPPDAVCFAETT